MGQLTCLDDVGLADVKQGENCVKAGIYVAAYAPSADIDWETMAPDGVPDPAYIEVDADGCTKVIQWAFFPDKGFYCLEFNKSVGTWNIANAAGASDAIATADLQWKGVDCKQMVNTAKVKKQCSLVVVLYGNNCQSVVFGGRYFDLAKQQLSPWDEPVNLDSYNHQGGVSTDKTTSFTQWLITGTLTDAPMDNCVDFNLLPRPAALIPRPAKKATAKAAAKATT